MSNLDQQATTERFEGSAGLDLAAIAEDISRLDEGCDPFAQAVRASPMSMVLTNPRLPDNPIAFVNDAFCAMSGYDRDEVVGRNSRFLQGEGTDPDAVARIREGVRTGASVDVEIRNYRKDGTSFWNRLLLAPIRDLAGDVTYYVGTQVDVTVERDRLSDIESSNAAMVEDAAGRRRERNEEVDRFRFAAEAGGLGTWDVDYRTDVMTTSRTCRLNFGRDPDAPFTYADVEDSVHPDDRDRVASAIRRSLGTRDEYDVEHRVVRADGSVGWVHLRARVTRDHAGKSVGMAGICLDATERRSDESRRQALVALGDRIRHADSAEGLGYACAEIVAKALDVARAGYGEVDIERETISIERDWNAPGVSSLAGILHFRDYGTYVEELKRGETVVVVDSTSDPRTMGNADALRGIGVRSFVNMPVTERGGFAALLFVNHDKARDWSEEEIAFLREMAERTRTASERIKAETELRELATSLEAQVEQRTRELLVSETHLRQSQKMEAVGQLTGGLAHDFNNLLTGITGSLEILRTRIAQGRLNEIDKYVNSAQGAAKRAAALTHRLLAFSRRQTLDPKPTNVNRLVLDMEDLLQRTVGPGIQVEIVGSAGLWTTLVDPNQLENALLNLCINARDAMPDGGRITVETANKWLDDRMGKERDLPPGQYLSLCVTDTGTGMPKDVVDRAFDPFFTTKPMGEGTGLGLSMIYGFARQSNGQVRIYSEVGQGTTVCVYLPRHLGHEAVDEHASEPLAATRAQVGETVLVVDDEPTVRMLVTEVLEDLGYVALEASDGPSGIKVIRSDARIDLLVTDVGLPNGMNGRQVADAARQTRPDLKVLFITGYAENAVIGNGHLDHDMHVMTKPFAMDALASKIRSIIEGGKA